MGALGAVEAHNRPFSILSRLREMGGALRERDGASMDLLDCVTIHNKIPGFMKVCELELLHQLARRFDRPGAVAVEVGSLHGRSSVALAHGLSAGVVHCIDLWAGDCYAPAGGDPEESLIKNRPQPHHQNTLTFFRENTKGFKNIVAMQASCPRQTPGLSLQCDLVFLDAEHQYPNERELTEFWLPQIKRGGVIAGDDYSSNWPDVIDNVDYLQKRLGRSVIHPPGTDIWYFEL